MTAAASGAAGVLGLAWADAHPGLFALGSSVHGRIKGAAPGALHSRRPELITNRSLPKKGGSRQLEATPVASRPLSVVNRNDFELIMNGSPQKKGETRWVSATSVAICVYTAFSHCRVNCMDFDDG